MNKKTLKLFSLSLVFLLLLTGLIPSIQDLLFPKTMAVEPDNTITETTKTYNVNTYHFYDFPPNSSEDENFVNGPYGGTNGYTPYWRYSQEYVEEQEWTGGFTLEPYCFRATTTDGKEEVTYCLNLGKASPDGIDMNYTSEILSTQLNRVIKMGYPSKSGADYNTSDVELEWATAVALKIVEGTYYNYVKDESLPSPLTLEAFTNGVLDKTFSRKYYTENQLTNAQIEIYNQKANFALDLIRTLVNYSTDESIKLDSIDMSTPQKEKINAKADNNFLAGPFNVALTSVDTATLQLKVAGITNYEITDANGNKLSTVDFGQNFYIKGKADRAYTIKITAYAVGLDSPTRIGYTTTAKKDGIPYQKMYVYETVTLQVEKTIKIIPVENLLITKIWDDNNNEQGLRPDSIDIQIYAGSTQAKYSLTEAKALDSDPNKWQASVALQKYTANGSEINWNVKEVVTGTLAQNYKTPVYATDSLTITNTIKEQVNLKITKQWDDSFNALSLRPASITVKVYGTNTQGATSGGTLLQTVNMTTADISTSSSNQWIKEISFINDNDYKYFYVTEDEIMLSNGYKYTPLIGSVRLVGDKTTVNNYTVLIKNTLPVNYIEFDITKNWEDERFENNRPNSITISIYGTNNLTNAQNKTNGTKVKDITLTNANMVDNYTWNYYEGFYFLETYNYYYLIESTGNNNYISTSDYIVLQKSTTRAGNPFDLVIGEITNTHKYTENILLNITKIWEDEDNQNSTRPTSIDIYLLQNGSRYGTITLNANNALTSDSNTWVANEIPMPKYDEDGNLYNYTIEEKITSTLQNNYQSPVYNQTTLTVINKIIPPVFHYKITVTKDIVNNNNQKANTNDFNKIKLNINDTYNFQIVLKEVSANYSYTGNIYNGVVTNKNSLVFSEIPAGRYEISENAVEYFKFVNFSRTNGTTGTSLEYLNGNYYIVISGTSNQDENIEIKVTNRIEDNRLYKDKNDEINLFLSSKKTETPI